MLKSEPAINVMLQVDRGEFCPSQPYTDTPMPIGYNATISAPHMATIAKLKDGARVLDVGSGSGYLSVCFAHLVKPRGKVVGIEHIEGLVHESIRNTRRSNANLLDSDILKFVVGDGREGYPEDGPYDVIHVGAASEHVPKALLDQLANDGIMVIPVGEFYQSIRVIRKDSKGKVFEQDTLSVRYVPLTDKDSQLNQPRL